MSFTAKLLVQESEFEVRRFSWGVSQHADNLNRPDAQVHGGQIYVELDSEPSELLHFWALDDTKRLGGRLLVLEADSQAVRKTLVFEDAYCVALRKHFDGSGASNGMVMALTISANKLTCGQMTLDNAWPL